MDERSELYPQRIQALTSLIQVSQALHMAQNLEEVLDRVLEAGGAAPGGPRPRAVGCRRSCAGCAASGMRDAPARSGS